MVTKEFHVKEEKSVKMNVTFEKLSCWAGDSVLLDNITQFFNIQYKNKVGIDVYNTFCEFIYTMEPYKCSIRSKGLRPKIPAWLHCFIRIFFKQLLDRMTFNV